MNSNIKIKKGQIEDYAVQKTGDQMIEGQKTFSINPRVSHTEVPNAVVNLEQMRAEMANTISEATLDTVLHSGNSSVKSIILEKPSGSNDLAVSADGLEFTNYGNEFDNLTLKWTTSGDGELLGTEIELPKKSGTLAVLEDISAHGLQEVLNNNSSATSETDIFIQRSQGNGSIQINEEQGVVIGGQAKGIILNGDSEGVKLSGSKIELNAMSYLNAPAFIQAPIIFQQFNSEEDYETTGTINVEEGNITINSSNETGLHYAADYSANFTDRSLVDKAYVDGLAGGDLQQTLDKGSEANFSTDLLLRKTSSEVGSVGEIQITDRVTLSNNGGEGIIINGHQKPVLLNGMFDIGGEFAYKISSNNVSSYNPLDKYLLLKRNGSNDWIRLGHDQTGDKAIQLNGSDIGVNVLGGFEVTGANTYLNTDNTWINTAGVFRINNKDAITEINGQQANHLGEISLIQTVLSSEAILVLTADKTVNYFANTGGATTWTLPPVSGNTGKQLIIVNKGSGNIAINTHEGNLELFDGAPLNAMPLMPGATYGLHCDGVHWTALY